jgi:hypothetical protein
MNLWMIVFLAHLAVASPAQSDGGARPRSLALPKGYSVPKITVSPDGRYGVLVPEREHYDWDKEQNKVVELKTRRVLATIHAHSGAVRANHVEIEAGNWSRDRSLFLWRVAGKWSPTALVLLKIRDGKVVWQRNILEDMQQGILRRTRRASPRGYRAAVRENRGSGAAFPDGFTIPVEVNVKPGEPLVLPLSVTASLTSNPKRIESYPQAARVNSRMTAAVSADGRISVKRFGLAPDSR